MLPGLGGSRARGRVDSPMEDGLDLLILIGIVAGAFWLGFGFGYRHRDSLSLQRRKKYRISKANVAVAGIEPATATHSDPPVSG
jgi:hypothetical protein